MSHWEVVKVILRYLKGTSDYGLVFCNGKGCSLLGYCDLDYARDRDEGSQDDCKL